jgi:hypothetical protein
VKAEDRACNPAPGSDFNRTSEDATPEVLVVQLECRDDCEWCFEPIEGRGRRFCSRKCWHDFMRKRAEFLAMTPEERQVQMAEVLERLDPDDTDSRELIQSAAEELERFTRLMGDHTEEETS